MAFLRFSRDHRGNENFYLVQPTVRRGKSRTRILYWFHSPPNVRVGRAPFDEATRKALEARYPDVVFDWKTIIETPIPSADTEKWRERRRLERAQKQAALEDDAAEAAAADADASADPAAAENEDATIESEAASAAPAPAVSSPPSAGPAGDAPRRNRRRRRGRRGEGSRTPQSADTRSAGAPTDSAAPIVTPPEPAGD